MTNSKAPKNSEFPITDIFPNLSAEELAEAEYNLKRYVELVWRIYERCSSESPGLLTEQLKIVNVKRLGGNGS